VNRLTRGRAVLGLLVLAGISWIVAGRDWTAQAAQTAEVPGVAAPGAAADSGSPLLTACAAIVAVCALLLAMLGRGGRWVISAIVVLAGIGYAAVAVQTLVAPRGALTGWPWAGLAIGVVIAAAGVLSGIAAGHWQRSNRYDRPAGGAAQTDDPSEDPTSAWDALSRGEDPS